MNTEPEVEYYVSDETSLPFFLCIALNYKLYVHKHYLLYRFLLMVSEQIGSGRRKAKRLMTWTFQKEKHSRLFWICCLALNEKKEPVGFLFFHGLLSMLYVCPAYRKQGVEETLYQEAAKKHDLSSKVYNLGRSMSVKSLCSRLGIANSIHQPTQLTTIGI